MTLIKDASLPIEPIKRAKISVRGIVQGVGFRPFVYQLASKHGLKGWVCNTSGDVKIEVEGSTDSLQLFLEQLKTKAPPLALIEEVNQLYLPPDGYQRFEIRESNPEKGKYQRISPDIATCPLCLQEILDKNDRRYSYPFTNCTNCGPRFTIIQDIPYDRPETTMRTFKMCPECQKEYDNPVDRRFHAQPNCCPTCGPKLAIIDQAGKMIASQDPVRDVCVLLKQGKVLALKGLGGFLLACDATNEPAVITLRQRKKRPFKPFGVMMASLEEVKKCCLVSPEEEKLLCSTKAPIVLLKLKNKSVIASSVAPNLNYLGVMLPYTPLHHLVMHGVSLPLVMTSGNLSEEPIAKDNEEALRRLSGIADYFIVHNRDIHVQFDDSVTMVENNKLQVLRRARSYAPDPIRLPFHAQEVLACGAELKNTFCITKDEYAFISQHIGDLDNLETFGQFEMVLDHYKKLFRLNPRIIVCDQHPDYLSSRYAQKLKTANDDLNLISVQHHHAHIVSCVTENKVAPPVLGVAFDGTGYGEDGCIWGGEFLVVDYGKFQRLGHLEYIPMPGGEKAIKKPFRMAISYLAQLSGTQTLNRRLAFLKTVEERELELIKKQIEKGINTPLTSSCGRLFDGVSALLNIRNEVDYEGQAAIELEMIAGEGKDTGKRYPFEIGEENGIKIVRLQKLFAAILEDVDHGVTKTEISSCFHHSVAHMVGRMCQNLARDTGIKKIALSGGVFQNRLLLRLTSFYLKKAGLKVIIHREVPTNDGGISLGQAVIGNFIA
ncbi:MAG: carbamoyltransferase HypF [Thermodesulfobacteriota bacterium]|jgi:hydrogenase maturation protein HypF|nr:MAG: carbamoyltransferase HypF [Thermodesulfobacteriota bacterium]